jgi:hypothetical protein
MVAQVNGTDYPIRGKFGGRLNAILQGGHAMIKIAEVDGVDNAPAAGAGVLVTGLKKKDTIIAVFSPTADATYTGSVINQADGRFELNNVDTAAARLVVVWLTASNY